MQGAVAAQSVSTRHKVTGQNGNSAKKKSVSVNLFLYLSDRFFTLSDYKAHSAVTEGASTIIADIGQTFSFLSITLVFRDCFADHISKGKKQSCET